ncbi:MAG: hypothetical protein HYZ75_14745 [Elusimicrobia bacterium]|nr:hypothetical protein [Elusimicrobiota bacterium]
MSKAGAAGLAAAGALGLMASVLCLASGAEWIRPYFYIPAWWSLLALVAGLNRRAGVGPGGPAFLRMTLLSVPFWLAYELLNLRLRNWEYHGLPSEPLLRWPGYGLAFATVLPGVLETAALLRSRWPTAASRPPRPWLTSPAGERASLALGLACLTLVLAAPSVFFPLAWAPAFLLCEPAAARARPRESWLAALAGGSTRPFWALMAAGLVCGLAWEALNFWSGAKWRYTVPWPPGPKLFEMPWLGYLGFPPFALGCASVWQAHEGWWETAELGARLSWAAALAVWCLLAFAAVDDATFIR